jgi:copper chaperone CopZ
MAHDVAGDHLAVIRIEGMHCHKCEKAIQNALSGFSGVHEVEVDFASGLASVLYDRQAVSIEQLTGAVAGAGYRVLEYNQRQTE